MKLQVAQEVMMYWLRLHLIVLQLKMPSRQMVMARTTNGMVTNGGACAKSIAVKVFNRYGQLVFRNDNYQNNWEGTNDGKPIPDGTYYYVITYNLVSGKTFQTKGDVTILR